MPQERSPKASRATACSLVVITHNNADTLDRCLRSARFVDELVVVDDHSTDTTAEIVAAHGGRLVARPFDSFGRQKQCAIDTATHHWVLLLDADEALSAAAAAEVRALLACQPLHHAYQLPRREWRIDRWDAPGVRLNQYLRLFDRRHARMNMAAGIHAAPTTAKPIGQIYGDLLHFGERSIAQKRRKLRRYAEDWAARNQHRPSWQLRGRQLIAPPWFFCKDYVLRRQCLNGSRGLQASWMSAQQAFWKASQALARK